MVSRRMGGRLSRVTVARSIASPLSIPNDGRHSLVRVLFLSFPRQVLKVSFQLLASCRKTHGYLARPGDKVNAMCVCLPDEVSRDQLRHEARVCFCVVSPFDFDHHPGEGSTVGQ